MPSTQAWFAAGISLALAVAGAWAVLDWFRQRGTLSWPAAQGRIESVEVVQGNAVFKRVDEPYCVAELAYSYSAGGQVYGGRYTRTLASEEEAREFVRDLKGKSVTVQYDAAKPHSSLILDSSFEPILQARGPAPPGVSIPPRIPDRANPLIWVFMALSAAGLAISLYVHTAAVFGRIVAPATLFINMHVGIFVVWVPAIFVAQRLTGNTRRKDFWKAVLRGLPEWVRYCVYGLFVYALLNFLYFVTQMPTRSDLGDPSTLQWRGFSGHWMAFYSAASAIFWSAAADRREP